MVIRHMLVPILVTPWQGCIVNRELISGNTTKALFLMDTECQIMRHRNFSCDGQVHLLINPTECAAAPKVWKKVVRWCTSETLRLPRWSYYYFPLGRAVQYSCKAWREDRADRRPSVFNRILLRVCNNCLSNYLEEELDKIVSEV